MTSIGLVAKEIRFFLFVSGLIRTNDHQTPLLDESILFPPGQNMQHKSHDTPVFGARSYNTIFYFICRQNPWQTLFFYYTPPLAIPGRENKSLKLELELKALHLVCLYILNHYICCTHSHVWSATSISGFSNGVHELTADSKVTQLYVSIPVQEDIWGFDVWKKENKSLFIKIKKKILRPNAQEIQDVKTVLYLCVLFSSFLLSGLVLSQSEKRKKISSVKNKKKKNLTHALVFMWSSEQLTANVIFPSISSGITSSNEQYTNL